MLRALYWMRRHWWVGGLLFFLLITASGCDGGEVTPLPSPLPATATNAVATETATAVPSASPLPSTTPIPSPTPTVTPIPPDLAIQGEDVLLYPLPHIYSGDAVTIQVLPFVPASLVPENVDVSVRLDGQPLASGVLDGRKLSGQPAGVFEWVWDTTGQEGPHQITIILDEGDRIQIGDEDPDNNQVTIATAVQPIAARPPAETNATWVSAETNCCFVHAVSNTAAYRDLPELVTQVEMAARQASSALQEPPADKLDIYFVDKVIGQGGYAGTSMVVSYLDRPYMGQNTYQTLVHEMVHLLDRQFAPQRISFLAEGVAVWASGGHYKEENVDERTAALVQIGEYVPLAQLIDNFYPVQHEVGYLEAAGFVSYLVQRDGWERFRSFYTDVTADDAPTLSQAMDVNLQIYYHTTLSEIEGEWKGYLERIRPSYTILTDLETTLRYYNVMRIYQQEYDPAAYFLTAWLPLPDKVRQQGNPADLTRHPTAEINVALEAMLYSADQALRQEEYNRANVLLDSVERVLANGGAFLDPLSLNYRHIVQATERMGYEAQQIRVEGNQAQVWVTRPHKTTLIQLSLQLQNQDWVILSQ